MSFGKMEKDIKTILEEYKVREKKRKSRTKSKKKGKAKPKR